MKLSHRWQGEADYDSAAERLAAARAALGPVARLMVDCYLSWSPAVADRMAELLAPYAPYWFEDVATPEHLTELAALRPRVKPVLLAGGEHDFTAAAFAEIARHGALDLWQPDVTWGRRHHRYAAYPGTGAPARGAGGPAPRWRAVGAAPDRRHRLRGPRGDDAAPLAGAARRPVAGRAGGD